ncbi:MAG: hypothetical protein EOM15_11300 [Spirochaetia bacterium]|nr:hypothetical protein [Spirochaetia bacterium]
MDKAQLQGFEEKIKTLLEQLKQTNEFLQTETGVIAPSVSLGRVTRMEAIGEKAINEHALSLNIQRINRLDNALKRIEQGTYGLCIRCGKEIPEGRLEQVPEALLCVQCAEKKR